MLHLRFSHLLRWIFLLLFLLLLLFWLFLLQSAPLYGAAARISDHASSSAPTGTVWPSGSITTDVTWTLAASPYTVNGEVRVLAGGTLTIEPGVVIQFVPHATGVLRIEDGGELRAEGTVAQPIQFTSSVTQPTPEYWGYIAIFAGGAARFNQIDVAYADGWGDPNGRGFLIYASDVEIHNAHFHDNRSSSVLYLEGAEIAPIFENVLIENNSGHAIYQNSATAQPIYHNLTLRNNQSSGVIISSSLGQITRDVSYDGAGLNGSPIILSGWFIIKPGNTLTVTAGTTLFLNASDASQAMIEVEAGGKLHAVGTFAQPITITSAAAGNPMPIFRTVRILAGGEAQIADCDISYGGDDYDQGVLQIFSSAVEVRNCRIHHNVGGRTVKIEGVDITPRLENLTIEANAGHALYQNSATAQPHYHNLTLRNNKTNGVIISNNSGQITQAVTYDSTGLNGSPLLLSGWFAIKAGSALTITPGSKIFMNGFDDGPARLEVEANARLYAVGTPSQPITITGNGDTQSPSQWRFIDVLAGAAARFAYCDLSYGGYDDLQAMVRLDSSEVELQHCRIHHSLSDGLRVGNDSRPLLRYNQFDHNGSTVGLRNLSTKVFVDARFNYWGDASGPHHPTLNPGGSGQEVSDRVLFVPWYEDTAGTLVQRVIFQILGPRRSSPGEVLNYIINYYSARALNAAVLLFSIPDGSSFLAASGNAAYYAPRSQVYWQLGDLPIAAEGSVTVTVQSLWGLPNNFPDAAAVMMGSPSLQISPYTINTQPYLDYIPVTVNRTSQLSEVAIANALQQSPALKTLHIQAIAQGYKQLGGIQLSPSDGKQIVELLLVNSQQQSLMTLYWDKNSGQAVAISASENGITVSDANGAITMDLQQNLLAGSGLWAPLVVSAAAPMTPVSDEIAPITCFRNCAIQETGLWAIKKLSSVVKSMLAVPACFKAMGGDIPSIDTCLSLFTDKISKTVPGYSEVKSLTKCVSECVNPDTRSKYVCKGKLTSVELPTWSWANPVSWTEGGRKRQYIVYNCNETTQMWGKPEVLYCPPGFIAQQGADDGYGHPCVPANENVAAAYGLDEHKVPSAAASVTMNAAKDPNAKVGLYGATYASVLPGQTLIYTVTCENEGSGTAYSVYIVDSLSSNLDESTLNLAGQGDYLPATRQIIWDVGDLTAKGQSGSTTERSFRIQPKAGLAMGTQIINQATVYFPSVPEVTSTNVVINTLQTLTALPQTVPAVASVRKSITLQGAGASGMSYELLELPIHGELTGTPPTLVYKSATGFVGAETFTFRVTKDGQRSQPAQVVIQVSANPADNIPPAVEWISPADGALLPLPQPALFTDSLGTGYYPLLTIQFSEPLNPESVNSSAIQLSVDGQTINTTVVYVAGLNQVVLTPRQPLSADKRYQLSLSSSIQDLNDNGLASSVNSSFQITTGERKVYLPVVRR